MGKGREIRSYDYVNHPYETVRDALSEDAAAVFRRATKVATSRVESVASELRVNLGGIEVATDIEISITKTEERSRESGSLPATHLHLEWEAARSPRLFPVLLKQV